MKHLVIGALLLSASASGLAGDSGTLAEPATLYRSPGEGVVAHLEAGVLVEVTSRESGWYRLRLVDGRVGFVRLRQVRFQEENASESVFGGLWSWLNTTRRSPDGMSTSTAGIRGFDEEDLAGADPDYEAVEDLLGLASSPLSARRFAGALSLQTRAVDDLPED